MRWLAGYRGVSDHVAYECDGSCRSGDYALGCNYCDGGLFSCTVCGSHEGASTTDCPGHQIHHRWQEGNPTWFDVIYAGKLDFVDGRWVWGDELWAMKFSVWVDYLASCAGRRLT